MTGMDSVATKLGMISRGHFSALPSIRDWPDRVDGWCMSPELLALHSTSLWAELGDEQRQRLSFWELVNFFSLNIHGERFLLAALANELYGNHHEKHYEYLHHFIDEENKHMNLFGTFCLRYAGKIYDDRKLSFDREYAPGERELLLFCRILVFEEIVDWYNVAMAEDDRLAPIVRHINSLHHMDEVRHLAYGRSIVRQLTERNVPSWSPEVRAGVNGYIGQYVSATQREYYNPELYRDAGFESPYDIAERAYAESRDLRKLATRKVVAFLCEMDLLESDPV